MSIPCTQHLQISGTTYCSYVEWKTLPVGSQLALSRRIFTPDGYVMSIFAMFPMVAGGDGIPSAFWSDLASSFTIIPRLGCIPSMYKVGALVLPPISCYRGSMAAMVEKKSVVNEEKIEREKGRGEIDKSDTPFFVALSSSEKISVFISCTLSLLRRSIQSGYNY